MVRTYLLATAILALVPTLPPSLDEVWRWDERKTSIMHYFTNAPRTYDLSLVRTAKSNHPWAISAAVSRNGNKIVEWETHHNGAFLIHRDQLIFAKHSSIATGCQIKAFDLTTGKQIWSTNLQGVGPVAHSIYRNKINLVMRDNAIFIYGNESAGQYIEKLNLLTGKQISHALGAKTGNKF